MQADAPKVEPGSEGDVAPMPASDANSAAMRNRALRFRADAVGKGRLLTLSALDKRTAAYRKTAELIDTVEADLGGADRLSAAERTMIRHAAVTGAMIEDLGTRWLAGEPVDPGMFSTLCNNERRLYETVGIKRAPRDVTPSLREYLAERPAPVAEAASGASPARCNPPTQPTPPSSTISAPTPPPVAEEGQP
jgi:hypothetical protein